MTLHRKLAVAFRDASLFKVFQVAIAAMQQLQSNASADEKLREQVLYLILPEAADIMRSGLSPGVFWRAESAIYNHACAVSCRVFINSGAGDGKLCLCRLWRLPCSVCPMTLWEHAWMSRLRTSGRSRCAVLSI